MAAEVGRARAPRALVTGATSLVGAPLLARLRERGFAVEALSRRSARTTSPDGVCWRQADIATGLGPGPEASHLFHLAPLWLLPPLVPRAAERGVERVVALGSTSRHTKAASPLPAEQALARRLAEAEAELTARASAHGIAWTVLRPTLIYAPGRDRSLDLIARFGRRFGFFPVAGAARGLRQPVHADDVAAACIDALRAPADRSYDLAGGSRLTYRELAEGVLRGSGCPPRVVSVPPFVVRGLLRLAALRPGWRHLTPAMDDRMNDDLCADDAEARRDFGWAPRPFSYRAAP
jgi:nucleoside-diphosphate-sugar epimerase